MSNISTTATDAADTCHNGYGGNNFRKYKRGQPCPKSKKQLENELNRQRSFYVASPQCRRSTLHDNTQVHTTPAYLTHTLGKIIIFVNNFFFFTLLARFLDFFFHIFT